jgi:hypothetical protein
MLEEATGIQWNPKEYSELLVVPSRVNGINDMGAQRHQTDKGRQRMPWRTIRDSSVDPQTIWLPNRRVQNFIDKQ